MIGRNSQEGIGVEECAMHGWTPRMSPRKVYDAVTYFQEHQLMLLRMHELNQSVDVHIVVEGDRSFRGDYKERNIHQHTALFAPFAHKLRVVEATLSAHPDISCPVISQDFQCAQDADETAGSHHKEALKGTWNSGERSRFKREWYTRNAALQGLWDADPDDLILMGDVDEIPRADFVRQLKWCDGIPVALGMTSRWFLYNISFQRPDWVRTPNVILHRALGHGEAVFARPAGATGVVAEQWAKSNGGVHGGVMRGVGISSKALRCYGFNHLIPWIEDVGWHLSYFGGTKSILKKISSFSDEIDSDVLTVDHIDSLISSGSDIQDIERQDVRQLLRTHDYSVLPAFLKWKADFFSSQLSSMPVFLENRDSEWRDCKRVRGGRLAQDHTSLVVSSCKIHQDVSDIRYTRVELSGGCDLPPRPWPPLLPCSIPLSSKTLTWTLIIDQQVPFHSPLRVLVNASQRPVVMI